MGIECKTVILTGLLILFAAPAEAREQRAAKIAFGNGVEPSLALAVSKKAKPIFINHSKRWVILGGDPQIDARFDKLARVLEGLDEPESDWRYGVLTPAQWAINSKELSSGNRGAYTQPSIRTTYINPAVLNNSEEKLARLLAHEAAHRATLDENEAERLALKRMRNFRFIAAQKLPPLPLYIKFLNSTGQ